MDFIGGMSIPRWPKKLWKLLLRESFYSDHRSCSKLIHNRTKIKVQTWHASTYSTVEFCFIGQICGFDCNSHLRSCGLRATPMVTWNDSLNNQLSRFIQSKTAWSFHPRNLCVFHILITHRLLRVNPVNRFPHWRIECQRTRGCSLSQ